MCPILNVFIQNYIIDHFSAGMKVESSDWRGA